LHPSTNTRHSVFRIEIIPPLQALAGFDNITCIMNPQETIDHTAPKTI